MYNIYGYQPLAMWLLAIVHKKLNKIICSYHFKNSICICNWKEDKQMVNCSYLQSMHALICDAIVMVMMILFGHAKQ